MSRPKIPILLYCADEERLSVAAYALGVHECYRVHCASCPREVQQVLLAEPLRGAVVLRDDQDEAFILRLLARVPVAVCGGESVPGCMMCDADTESMLHALREITSIKRGPKPETFPYNWRNPSLGLLESLEART